MKSKSRCSDVLEGLKGDVAEKNYIGQVKPDIKKGRNLLDVRVAPDLYSGQRCGFTLIELLVVVLIIGILASIALPQYQKAVEKSKAAQAFTLLHSLHQAQKAYFLANGTYATKFDELAVDIPWTGNTKWFNGNRVTDTRSNQEWSVQILTSDSINGSYIIIGRLTGKYAGAGFAANLLPSAAELARGQLPDRMDCWEAYGQAVNYSAAADMQGAYCAGLFKGTLLPNTNRIYTLP